MEGIDLHNKKNVKNELVEIVENYSILHFDEFPILYIGTNKFGNKIIGSHLEEDDSLKRIWTLHTILSNREYHQFLNGKFSYLNILKESQSICLVEKDFNFKTKVTYDLDFEDIPKEYLPLEDSYCPTLITSNSLNFTISLKGKLADINKAMAEEVSAIQNGFSEFLEDRIKSLKGFNLIPKALLQPYTEGSFRINVELNFNQKGKTTNLFLKLAPIEKFVNEYIKYISNDFKDDKDIFKSNESELSDKLKLLEQTFNELYDKAYVTKPDKSNEMFKDEVLKSLQKFGKISERVGGNFESVEILNVANSNETPVAYLDKEFSESLRKDLEEIEISKKGITIDEDYRNYDIYIYHLNTDNRSGNALIRNLDSENEMSKPKIKILGEEGLDQSKYTESLHLNKWINVSAKAKRIGNKYTYLDIEFESE